MTTGSAFGSLLAAMIAPRKLQSLGATVQALAPARSSFRSTSKVVTNRGRGAAEREAACWVKFKNTPPSKMPSVNTDQVIFLFMRVLQLISFSVNSKLNPGIVIEGGFE